MFPERTARRCATRYEAYLGVRTIPSEGTASQHTSDRVKSPRIVGNGKANGRIREIQGAGDEPRTVRSTPRSDDSQSISWRRLDSEGGRVEVWNGAYWLGEDSTNNQAEYSALIEGMAAARGLGIKVSLGRACRSRRRRRRRLSSYRDRLPGVAIEIG